MKLIKSIILISLFNIISTYSYGNEKIDAIVDQMQILTKDLKTLEKAVYNKSDVSNSSGLQSNDLNEDVLTRHLLKLNKIEDQFRELTNRFEEINFKMDKLSSRITKIQSDTQIRLSDLEDSEDQVKISKKKVEKKIIYPVLTNRKIS